MAQVKFSVEAKQIFIDAYNDASISYKDLNKVITENLQEAGLLDQDSKLTAQDVRRAFKGLGMEYKNRPKGKKEELIIVFEDGSTDTDDTSEDTNTVEDSETEETEEEVAEDVIAYDEPSQYVSHLKEPTKFEF